MLAYIIIRYRYNPVRIATIVRDTATLWIDDTGTRFKKREFPNLATDEQLKEASDYLLKKKETEERQQQKANIELAEKKSDPRYELLQRFGSGADFEPWKELTLWELQQIARILDAAKIRKKARQYQ